MERTYRAAGLDPAKTSYVEAHGTGTPAGDPIEAASLSKVFAKWRPVDNPLAVGSVKSNIGHLEGGSGVVGVVKVVLMLENSLILPKFDFRTPSNWIPMHEWNIKVKPYPSLFPAFLDGLTGSHLRSTLAYRGCAPSFRKQLWFWWQQCSCCSR